jgi:phospholipid transport system substrate-binding protein
MMLMTTRTIGWLGAATLALAAFAASAQTAKAPDAFIKEVSTDVLEAVKADKTIRSGDINKVIALVDQKVFPYVNFQRMTASAVGRYWKQATPEQQKRLQDEFKPMRASPTDAEVVVRTEIRGKGDPIQLDYRLEKDGAGWKIYDVNVLGVWLVENYRNSFAQEIGANGIDGLIAKLAERNKSAAAGKS